MCEIVYEEIDNKEEIDRELKDMIFEECKDNEKINAIIENIFETENETKSNNSVSTYSSPIHYSDASDKQTDGEIDHFDKKIFCSDDNKEESINDLESLNNDKFNNHKDEIIAEWKIIDFNSQMNTEVAEKAIVQNCSDPFPEHVHNFENNLIKDNVINEKGENMMEITPPTDIVDLTKGIPSINNKFINEKSSSSQSHFNEDLNDLRIIMENKNYSNNGIEKELNSQIVTKVTQKEVSSPRRISELYSQFNASWKDRLKSKPFNDSINSTINYTAQEDVSDVDISENEIMSDDSPVPTRKAMCVESSCYSASDEINISLPVKPKNVAVSSIDCGFDSDTPVVPKISKTPFQKPIYADSSCNSISDNVNIRSSESANTRYRINPIKVQGNMTTTTTSTETGTEDEAKTESTFGTQIDETYNSLEEKILPFVKNQHTIELRLKGRLSVFQRACVKQIATQHKLIIKHVGKGKDSFVMLRKKIELVNSQKLFLEMKRNEMEKRKENVLKEKARQERLLNPPLKVSSGCQADMTAGKEESTEKSKNATRRNRKKQWEMKQKQISKKSSSTQTVAKGYYLCPYCEGDIPESHQSVHYPYCLSKYRSQIQAESKSGNVGKDKRLISHRATRPISSDRKQRSKSRDNIKHSKLDIIRKELDKIHSNDINSMVNAINELSKKCVVPGCNKKKQKTCDDCTEAYCNSHFSPENVAGDTHFNCPVALERAENNRLKNLGINNPLFKTVEELSAPKFPDGSLLKKPKRVRLVAESAQIPTVQSTVRTTQDILPPNLNETRTRNGPILSFERNELQKRLREKIGEKSDRRTK